MTNTSRTHRFFATLTIALGLTLSAVGCDADTGDEVEIREGDAASLHTLIELVADGESETTELVAYFDQCGEHVPGDLWDEACNVCTCNDNGTVWCTRVHCGTEYATPDFEDEEPGDVSCGEYEVGEEWQVECNTCRCNEEGVTECTLVMCDGEDII